MPEFVFVRLDNETSCSTLVTEYSVPEPAASLILAYLNRVDSHSKYLFHWVMVPVEQAPLVEQPVDWSEYVEERVFYPRSRDIAPHVIVSLVR